MDDLTQIDWFEAFIDRQHVLNDEQHLAWLAFLITGDLSTEMQRQLLPLMEVN